MSAIRSAHPSGGSLIPGGFQPVIDALTAHVALCDRDGRILAVNAAWRAFADANGGGLPNYGIGANYLGLLDGLRDPGDDARLRYEVEVGQKVAAGLRGVLDGAWPRFRIEYRCDAPTERRWFLLTVTRFPEHGAIRAVVSHENVTALKLAEEATIRQNTYLVAAFRSAIDAIALLAEARDPYTAGHQKGVAHLCDAIAATMGLALEARQGLHLGATIHDIGKISIPAEILVRPGRLSELEYALIRCHPQTGYDVLKGVSFPWPIAEMVHQHHERLDGSGYPRGLQGDAICLEARIIAVADVYDAITSHRPYRAARNQGEAVAELLADRGKAYDPAVVDALLHLLESHQPP